MSHSHLIIGHVTNTSVKIWVRAGNKNAFTPDAEIRLSVIDSETDNQVFDDHYIITDEETLGCHSFNVTGINPQHLDFKQYTVNAIVTINGTEEHHLAGSFRTAPKQNANFSFLLGSCYFSQGRDYKSPEYRDLSRWARKLKPLFMMNTGDQIYIDVIQGGSGLIRYDIDEYVNRYLDTWYAKATRRYLANLPQYMILDDHEIYNNFMRPKPHQKNKTISFHNAKTVYRWFEHIHNPGSDDPDVFFYDFDVGGTSFFVLDVRTEKTKHQMLSDDQLAAFKTWLQDKAGRMKFIVTPVPLIIQLKKGQQKDKWSGERYQRQRNLLFQAIVEAGCKKVLFLTGDIHLACHARIDFDIEGDPWAFHELSSSPIKQLQFWIIDRKIRKLAKPTDESSNFFDNVDFHYRLIKYMGKSANAHDATAYTCQNNAMHLRWDSAGQSVSYQSLPLNTKSLNFIFHGRIDF